MYRVPNICAMRLDVGGTVESQGKPIAAPNPIAFAGDGGSMMKIRIAIAASEINARENVPLRHPAAEPARAKRAYRVREADDGECPAPTQRKPEIAQIGGHVRGDEGEMEAAGEEADDEQVVAAVTESFAQRLRDRLA